MSDEDIRILECLKVAIENIEKAIKEYTKSDITLYTLRTSLNNLLIIKGELLSKDNTFCYCKHNSNTNDYLLCKHTKCRHYDNCKDSNKHGRFSRTRS